MPTFALEPIQEIEGRIAFFKLVIDGDCPFDEFCDRIINEGNQVEQLK